MIGLANGGNKILAGPRTPTLLNNRLTRLTRRQGRLWLLRRTCQKPGQTVQGGGETGGGNGRGERKNGKDGGRARAVEVGTGPWQHGGSAGRRCVVAGT